MLEKGLYWPAVTIGVGVLPPSPLWTVHWWRLQSHVHGPCKWRVSSHPYSNGRVSTIWKQVLMWYSYCLRWSCKFVRQLAKLPWSWWMDTIHSYVQSTLDKPPPFVLLNLWHYNEFGNELKISAILKKRVFPYWRKSVTAVFRVCLYNSYKYFL